MAVTAYYGLVHHDVGEDVSVVILNYCCHEGGVLVSNLELLGAEDAVQGKCFGIVFSDQGNKFRKN